MEHELMLCAPKDTLKPYKEPTSTYATDAGLDLFVSGEWAIPAGESLWVDHNTAVALPPGTFGWITGRSSTLYRRNLRVEQGIIDEGFRGSLWACVQNSNPFTVYIHSGDRLAQLIVLPTFKTWGPKRVFTVDSLPPSERGNNGFGSTGQ